MSVDGLSPPLPQGLGPPALEKAGTSLRNADRANRFSTLLEADGRRQNGLTSQAL